MTLKEQATEWQRVGNQIDAAMIFAQVPITRCVVVAYPQPASWKERIQR